jgi:hypothetical protein
MRGPLRIWWTAPAGDGGRHPPGLETPHNTDTVHYFLDRRNGVLTRMAIEGNKGADRHIGKEPPTWKTETE